jgi:hypothetical protein
MYSPLIAAVMMIDVAKFGRMERSIQQFGALYNYSFSAADQGLLLAWFGISCGTSCQLAVCMAACNARSSTASQMQQLRNNPAGTRLNSSQLIAP